MLGRGDTTPEDKREQEERVWQDKRRWATKRELEAGAHSGAFLSHKMHSPLGIVCMESSCYIHTGTGKSSDYQSKFFEGGSFGSRKYIKASRVSWLDQSWSCEHFAWVSSLFFLGNVSITERNLLHPFANPYIKDSSFELSLFLPFLGCCPTDTSALSTFCIMSRKPHVESLKLPEHEDWWAVFPYSELCHSDTSLDTWDVSWLCQSPFTLLPSARPVKLWKKPLLTQPCCGASQSGIPASSSLQKENTIVCVSCNLGGKVFDNEAAGGATSALNEQTSWILSSQQQQTTIKSFGKYICMRFYWGKEPYDWCRSAGHLSHVVLNKFWRVLCSQPQDVANWQCDSSAKEALIERKHIPCIWGCFLFYLTK